MRFAPWIGRALLAIMLVPLLGLAWCAQDFLPYRPQLLVLVAKGKPDIAGIEPVLLAFIDEQRMGWTYTARQARAALMPQRHQEKHLLRQLRDATWVVALRAILSEDELLAVWAQCAIDPCSARIKNEAVRAFGREPTRLRQEEIAMVAALAESPGTLALGSEANMRRAQTLIDKAPEITAIGLTTQPGQMSLGNCGPAPVHNAQDAICRVLPVARANPEGSMAYRVQEHKLEWRVDYASTVAGHRGGAGEYRVVKATGAARLIEAQR